VERLGQLLAARAPWFAARPTEIYWSTLALFESRLTRSFGRGAVWLAGDAAHQAAPVAVQSMNSGLIEARDLATRMSRVLRAEAVPSLLDEHAVWMRAEWHRLLRAASPDAAAAQRASAADDAAGAAVRALPGASEWVRQHAERIVACLPASGGDLDSLLGQVGLTVFPAPLA
jgi:2-polyprenyl-6-methoxyphenol hydroxylase-like FAD-dependent oxidoreductase